MRAPRVGRAAISLPQTPYMEWCGVAMTRATALLRETARLLLTVVWQYGPD